MPNSFKKTNIDHFKNIENFLDYKSIEDISMQFKNLISDYFFTFKIHHNLNSLKISHFHLIDLNQIPSLSLLN